MHEHQLGKHCRLSSLLTGWDEGIKKVRTWDSTIFYRLHHISQYIELNNAETARPNVQILMCNIKCGRV